MRRVVALLLAPALLGACGGTPRAPAVARVSAGGEVATGFLTEAGRLTTVAHVLTGPVSVDGGSATVVRIDRTRDLAVLAVSHVNARPQRAPGPHLLVLRDGRPTALPATVRRHIRATVGTSGPRDALELAVQVQPGDSGAPFVTSDGRVAGVLFASSNTRHDTAYAGATDH